MCSCRRSLCDSCARRDDDSLPASTKGVCSTRLAVCSNSRSLRSTTDGRSGEQVLAFAMLTMVLDAPSHFRVYHADNPLSPASCRTDVNESVTPGAECFQ